MTQRLLLPLLAASLLWAAPLEEAPIKVAQEVRSALVQIEAKGHPRIRLEIPPHPWEDDAPPPFRFEFDLDRFFRRFREYFQHPFQTKRIGSGFIFRRDGDHYYILTSAHVVRKARDLTLRLYDGTVFHSDEIEVLGADRETDIAVLRISSEKPLTILKTGDSDDLKVGQWVIAAGNPLGYTGSFSIGIISALGRSGVPLPEGPSYQEFIQFDATVGPGSSGGPLLDLDGRVIGVITALSSWQTSSGFGFAIPINTALWVAESLIEEGRLVRGYLGVRIQDLTPELAEGLGLRSAQGALVTEVLPETPAEKAGLQEGDVILKVGDQAVGDADALRLLIARNRPGKRVKLQIAREGKIRTIEITLAEYPEEETSLVPHRTQDWGLEVEQTDEGVRVTEVAEGSPADAAGLQEGDLIRKIGKREIRTLQDFRDAIKAYRESPKPVVIVIERSGHRRYLALRP